MNENSGFNRQKNSKLFFENGPSKKHHAKNSSLGKKKRKDKLLLRFSGSQQKNLSAKSLKDYQPSEEIKKLLDAPLNSSQDYPGHYEMNSSRNSSDKTSDNTLRKIKRNSSTKKELKRRARQLQRSFLLDRSVPYSERCYSDRLGLEKQYLTKSLTPISKTFKESMLTAADLQISIQNSLQSFQQTLQEARCDFLRLQPSIDCVFQQASKTGNYAKISPFLNLNFIQQTCEANTPKAIPQLVENGSYLIESSDESVLNMMPHRADMIASEDAIYYEKLAELGEEDFYPGQLEAVKAILSKQSCLFRTVKPLEKSTVFKVLALMCQGLVVYVSSSINYMTDQIQKLPSSVFGACYNNLVSPEKVKQMQELVKSGEVKMLFITMERLINDLKFQMPNAAFVVFDEPHCCFDLSTNQKLSHKNFHIALKKRFKSVPLLAIVPQITTEEAIGICQQFEIDRKRIFPSSVRHYSRPTLTISCDQEPTKALVSLLKNKNFVKDSSVLLYVEGRKTAEELSEAFSQENITHQIFLASKTEIQKLQMINNFAQQRFEVLIIPSGIETGMERSLIKRTIHYNLPKSAEILIQEILCLGEDAHSHIFVSTNDYFKSKVAIFADTLDSAQVSQFIDIIMEANPETPQKATEDNILSGAKRRRDGTPMNSDFAPNSDQLIGPKSNILQKVDETISLAKKMKKPGVYSMKVSEMVRRLNLRKDHMLLLFEMFETTGNWLKFLGVNPLLCSIQLFQENFPLNENSNDVLNHLISKARKPKSHIRIQLPEFAAELNTTPAEAFKTLKTLQNERAVKIDILEEVLSFRIKNEKSRLTIQGQIESVTQYLSKKAELAQIKLDAIFAAARKASSPTVEEALNYQERHKMENSKLANPRSTKGEIVESNTLNYQDSSIFSNELPFSFKIFEWFDQYLNISDTLEGLQKFFNDPSEMKCLLPTARNLRDHKEQLTFLKEFLNEYIDALSTQDSQFLDPKAYEPEQLRSQISRNIARIGMGIPCFDLDRDWKA